MPVTGLLYRSDFQELSRARRREAKVLLDAGQYAGAYYLAGYAAECALKACIAKATRRYQFPSKKEAERAFTHDLSVLLDLANLSGELAKGSAALQQNWAVVKDWNEHSRYWSRTKVQAEAVYHAMTTRNGGVTAWIRKHW